MAACAIAAAVLCHSEQANAAGAAYQVDTAEVSEAGSCKVESWVSTAQNGDFVAAVAPACVVGLFRPIEFSAQITRTRTDGEWGSAVTPKIKTNIIPSAIGSWGVAITATAAYDALTRQNTSLAVTVPATLRLSNVVRINANAGWQLDRIEHRHYFTYGAGFDWRTPDNVWTLTGEVFGLAGTNETWSVVASRFQLGLRFRPIDRFNIDLIYGRNIGGENSNWLTVATIVRFPARDR